MSKKKTHISKKKLSAVKKNAPKRAHKPYKKYEKHHTRELELLDKRMPGAIDAVERAKEKMDKAIRNAKRKASWKRLKKWETEPGPMRPEDMEDRIWVPKRVMRRKELEQEAAYFEKDRTGKTRLQSGLDRVIRMGELAERWSGGGYVTYAQIQFMAEKLGIDVNVMLDYNLLQMSDAIHATYETELTTSEREEFGYVETGRGR